MECEKCKAFNKIFLKNNPDRYDYAMCEECMKEAGIVLMDFPFKPEKLNAIQLEQIYKHRILSLAILQAQINSGWKSEN